MSREHQGTRQPFRPSRKRAIVSPIVRHPFPMHAERRNPLGAGTAPLPVGLQASLRVPSALQVTQAPLPPGTSSLFRAVCSLPWGTQPVSLTDTWRKRAGAGGMGGKHLYQVCLLLPCRRATAKSLCRVSISLLHGCLLCPFSPNYKVVGNIHN